MVMLKPTISSIVGKHGGQWTRGCSWHYLSWSLEFPRVSQFRRTLSRCAVWMKCATSCHARSGESQPPEENKLQSWGCINVDAIARATVSKDPAVQQDHHTGP